MPDFIIHFPVSGVTTWYFLPTVVGFFLAYFGAMAGVTGAFLLIPFQMSVLGYTSPGVSATNFVYNIVAIPGTVWRYGREGRLCWPLVATISAGSLPGIAAGYWVRMVFLTDPRFFRPFVGGVLLYLAWLMFRGLRKKRSVGEKSGPGKLARIGSMQYGMSRMSYEFDGVNYSFDPRPLFAVALLVGIVGGAFGIGGGAVLAPFCIAVLQLPVHSIAGASLLGTLLSSLVGVGVYTLGGLGGAESRPDFLLGGLFGIGGMTGGYLGARTQKYVKQQPIKIGLFVVLVVVAARYILAVL
ncbi:MAG: sulfite exporter TauE/SafE family protein [Proteobacteria bacterium]|nr:sulfite exporter TauE/SafE family protein [Pseudomonadota bacterium]MBU1686095.1 sulfite exporter TauE/SafE family protein [Pseudomonadota bacterium]